MRKNIRWLSNLQRIAQETQLRNSLLCQFKQRKLEAGSRVGVLENKLNRKREMVKTIKIMQRRNHLRVN
jgi:hypothetical protein